jgi:membrane associated rhomboid family serine protease
MIPIKDDNPQINTPYATYLLIFLNIMIWLIVQNFGSGDQYEESICKFGLIPYSLIYEKALTTCLELNQFGYLSILSSMFLHGGWMHILGNLLFLWVFGGNVEDTMGSLRFICFYIFAGIAAGIAQIITNIESIVPMIGASGAIGGVMGAYLILFPKVKVHILVPLFIIFWTFRVPAFAMLGYWIVLQIFDGLNSFGSNGGGIAFWAHIGGFFFGVITIHLFKDNELLHGHPYHGWKQKNDASSIWENPMNKQK